MNLFLHNIGDIDSDNFYSPADALIADDGRRFDYVLANLRSEKKQSEFTNEQGEQEKEDLTTTSRFLGDNE